MAPAHEKTQAIRCLLIFAGCIAGSLLIIYLMELSMMYLLPQELPQDTQFKRFKPPILPPMVKNLHIKYSCHS